MTLSGSYPMRQLTDAQRLGGALRWAAACSLAVLLIWLVVSTPVQAEGGAHWDVFRSAPSGQGPASDSITSLLFDDGTLWIGTTGGLSRYDGGVWESYREEDGLPDNRIQALLVDRQGYLWIGTARGVLLLGPERRWVDRSLLASDLMEIETLSLATGEGVWIGTLQGATRWSSPLNGSTAQRQDISLDAAVVAIWEAGPDDVWFGTRGDGLIHQRSGMSQAYTVSYGLPSPWVHALLADGQGDLWVGTQGGACRLSLADPDAGCRPLDQLRSLAVTGLFADPDGAVWVATDVGLWRFRGDRLLESIRPTSETALGSDDVRAIAQDAEGQLWLGTTGGLARRRARIWEQLLPESSDLLENDVRMIAEDAAGNLWVATSRGLKWRNPAGQWHSIAQLAGDPVQCLWAEADGSLWSCLERGVAHVWPSGQVESPAAEQDLMNVGASAIRRGPDGALWLATGRGVWSWDGEAWAEYRQDTPTGGPVNNAVFSIAPDGAFGLWFGTLGGLSHFDGQQWLAPERAGCQVEDRMVRALAWEGQGRLWVGTDAGLVLCEGGQQHPPWVKRDGLVSDDIRVLALEAAGSGSSPGTAQMTLWVGTFDGLSCANLSEDAQEPPPFVSFAGESLPHDRVQAIHVSRDYGVLIGTPNGLWAYQPSLARPRVRLRHHDTLLQQDQHLALAHDEPAALFAAGGDLRTPADKLIYRYEIAAAERSLRGWSLDGTLPITDVLQPGDEITVMVWAFDRDFNESARPARLEVERLLVPLLEQPWFLGLMGTILVGGAIVSYRAARTWRRYGYRDLQVTIASGDTEGFHSVRLQLRRGPRFPRYELPFDANLIGDPLRYLSQDKANQAVLRFLGESLYGALVTPEAEAHLREHSALGRRGVRLRLRFENVPSLAALPWEFLHGGDDLGFLTVQSDVALVRDLSPEEPEGAPRTRPPLKLMVAWATPQDLLPLDVTEEVRAIEAAFAGPVGKGRALVQVLEHARPETFVTAVQEGYDLIHFVGHGGVQEEGGVLYFEEEDGEAVSMAQGELIALLAETATFTDKTPKLVVLNACQTAESGESEGLAGLAAALVAEGRLPAVVGMGYEITSNPAAIFSRAFYETLVRHGQVDHAVAKGREALFAEIGAGQRNWGVPRLYMRTPKGIIFDIT